MAKLSDGRFLVVHDVKRGDQHPAPAVGLITFVERVHGSVPAYAPVELSDSKARPNDLEAVCVLPGRPGEVLAAESRIWQGEGHLWRLAANANAPQADVVAKVPLPPGLADDEIEGIACLPTQDDAGEVRVLLGLRGGGPAKPATIWQGVLDLRTNELRPSGKAPVTLRPPEDVGWRPGAQVRGCADLLFIPAGGDRPARVLAVAAEDPGDSGPFQSVIYEAATVGRDGWLTPLEGPGRTVAVLAGLKVEALAAGVTVLAKGNPTPIECPYTIATDDEAYGGIWRPLFPPAAR